MRAGQTKAFLNIAATTDGFNLYGGAYVLEAVATWTAGTVKLQRLGPDATTYLDVTGGSLTANGETEALALPPGVYRINVATSTAVYVRLSRIPGE